MACHITPTRGGTRDQMVAGATRHSDKKKEEGMGNLVHSFVAEGRDVVAGDKEDGSGGVQVYGGGGVLAVFWRRKRMHEVEYGPAKLLLLITLLDIDGQRRNQCWRGSGTTAKIFKSRRTEESRGARIAGIARVKKGGAVAPLL